MQLPELDHVLYICGEDHFATKYSEHFLITVTFCSAVAQEKQWSEKCQLSSFLKQKHLPPGAPSLVKTHISNGEHGPDMLLYININLIADMTVVMLQITLEWSGLLFSLCNLYIAIGVDTERLSPDGNDKRYDHLNRE